MTTTTTRKSNAKKPAAAKAPEDHKPKVTAESEAKKVEQFTVTLLGRDWVVDSSVLNDFELLEKLSVMDGGGGRAASVMPSVLRELLGSKQYAEAMDALRDEDTGRVAVDAGAAFVFDILRGLDPNS